MDWGAGAEVAAVVLATVLIGVVAHEFAHALALRLGGVPCRVEPLPDAGAGPSRLGCAGGRLASVRPVAAPAGIPSWRLRAAAMAPLGLLLPLALVVAGVVPDPFGGADVALQVATITWIGCALPSPSDFSILWYPQRSLEAASDPQPTPA